MYIMYRNLVLLGLTLFQSRIWGADLSISGIRLGMTLDQAKAKIGPSFTIESQKNDDDPNHVLTIASIDHSEAYVFLTQNNKLLYIEHAVSFKEGEWPNVKTTIQELQTKFGGKEDGRDFTGHDDSLFWVFDGNGKLMPPGRQEAQALVFDCSPRADPVQAPIQDWMHNYLVYPTGASPHCFISAGVEYAQDPLKGTIGVYSIRIEDNQAMYRWAKTMNDKDKAKMDAETERSKRKKAPM